MLYLEGKRVLLTGASGFIGTNLVDLLVDCGATVANADLRPPTLPAHNELWRRCDVGCLEELQKVAEGFDPHHVVHLAARTDTNSKVAADYEINHIGTRNVVRALQEASSAERFVFVSSQFVLGPRAHFISETDYAPHTAYGESKADAEGGLRADPPHVTWTIVRPTNVWGPWHLRYQRQFWRVLQRGFYIHPNGTDPVRSYGYVGSVSLQILAILLAEPVSVDGRALYLGDWPTQLSEWVDTFSAAITGRPARRVPRWALAALASVGDLVETTGLAMPLNSERYSSMTTDYPTPMERTKEALGTLPSVPLDAGVAQTLLWLRDGRPADTGAWLRFYSPAQTKEHAEADG